MPSTQRKPGAPRRARRLSPPESAAPRWSPERAFVVQLESRRASGRPRIRGRVEHLSSGEARRFESLTALVGFLSRFQQGGE